MIKRFVLSLVFVLLLLFFPKQVLSQDEFIVDVNVDYDVQQTGITKVTHTITLENAFSNLYAKSYLLKLENIDPINAQAFQGSKSLELIESSNENTVSLQVIFDDVVVGKGEKRTFIIVFEENSFAVRTGEIWEVLVPRLSGESSFRVYTINLLVPSSFGTEAYISPEPLNIGTAQGKIKYSFDKELIQTSGITAGFGKFQVFSFSLNYHLENPLSRTAKTEIAIPPDTAFQKLYYQSINPEPSRVYIDDDGNWLAEYTLKARERLDVTVLGAVQIFASHRDFLLSSQEQLQNNLAESEFWQTNDPELQALAERLKTPEAIYDFVTTSLNYNYERVRPNISRYGAKAALANPNDAICMEFTDLFIALARAAGIPAREINGFAYTENPEIQPLSLVADVLHSWPEYWDEEKGTWIPLDPTWGSTTGGVDFFNKLDLRHFTFVIHGKNPLMPYPPGSYKLGPNPQKDVFVNFGQLPEERISVPEITAEIKKGLPFNDSKIVVLIENPGPVALYNLEPSIYFDDRLVDSTVVSILPPYASHEFYSRMPFSFLATETPREIKIVVGDSTMDIPTNRAQIIIYNFLVIFFILLAVTLFFIIRAVIRTKKIKIKEKIKLLIKLPKFRKKKKEEVYTKER